MVTEKVELSSVPYGTVQGRFLYALPDAADAGLVPDVYATSDLEVKFTPSVPLVRCGGVTFLPKEFTAHIDREGYLLGADGDRTLTILATSADGMEPSGWTWTVEINHEGVPPFIITIPAGDSIDLANFAPVEKSGGVVKIVDADTAAQVSARLSRVVDLTDQIQGLEKTVRTTTAGIDDRLANVQGEAAKVAQAREQAETAVETAKQKGIQAVNAAKSTAEQSINGLISQAQAHAGTATAKASEATRHAETATAKAGEATAKAAEAKRDADYVREAIRTHGGLKGERGEPGAPGRDGTPGAPGKDGKPGAKGEPGRTPVISIQGDRITVDGTPVGPNLTGPRGLQGLPGRNGDPGPVGPPGQTPTIGMNGDQVTVNGRAVGPHLTGPRGLQGLPGQPGTGVIDANTGRQLKVWKGTKTEYDRFSFKDPDTLYFITG